VAKHDAPRCEKVDEPTELFRFVRRQSMDVAVLHEELQTDGETGWKGGGREKKYKKLLDARSVYEGRGKALARWRINKRGAEIRGEDLEMPYLAQITIDGDEGFSIERRGQKGHRLLWGDTSKVVAKVARILDPAKEPWGEDG
jgi:hypothetical protein